MARRRRAARAQPIRFRLSLAGWALLGIAVLVGVAAVKSQTAMMFVLFGGMMGALQVSAVMSRRAIRAVEVRRDLPARAWQNQTVHLGYFLRNRRRAACLSLNVEERAPEGLQRAAGHCVHLPGRGMFRAGGRFVVRRRGRIRLSGTQVSTDFPFGLISAGRFVPAPASLVVWPARGRLRAQILKRGAVETSTAAPSRNTGGGDEFFGLREYRPGDNPRWVHWRRSAMRAAPVIREMTHPLPEVLWVILDTHLADLSGMGEQTRERRLRFAATLIDHAFARGYKVALALAYSDRVEVHPPAAGRGHWTALLDALADVDNNTTRPVGQTIASLHRAALRSAQVVLVVDEARALSAGAAGALRSACRHLVVVDERRMAEVFEDDPLAVPDSPPAAPAPRERRPAPREAPCP